MNRPQFRLDQFRKSNRSENPPGTCVHVARGMGWVLVRDTKEVFDGPTDHKLAFPAADFDAFLAAIRVADLRSAQIPAGALAGTCIAIDRIGQDINVLRSTVEQPGLPQGAVLTFTDAEITAFLLGVLDGEFDVEGEYTAHDAACVAGCTHPQHVELAAV